MLHIILLLLPGVLSNNWRVIYSDPICAVRGSNVTIACKFSYPAAAVTQMLWCLESLNQDCKNTPNVYDSKVNNTLINFQYKGDNVSDCSLLISNINLTDSGEYRFRFITTADMWTGGPGVKLSVHDLRVSMTTSRENGSTIVGDMLNLTCKLNCFSNLAEVQWFKNGDLMQQSKPILMFNSVTAKDSGNYSCSLKNVETTLSDEYRIYIEDVPIQVAWWPKSLIIGVLVSVIFIIVAVMLLRRKAKTQGKPKTEDGTLDSQYANFQKPTGVLGQDDPSAIYSNLQGIMDERQEDEVQYASVNIKPKKLLQMSVDGEQQNVTTIYCAVSV